MAERNDLSWGGMPTLGRMKSTPIPVARTRRRCDIRVLSSFMPGKMIPVAAFGLLREDRLSLSRFRLNFEMMETAELLMNAVNVRVMAYLVPNLAFDRFNGIDQLNRSYMKEPETDGGTVVPFIKTATAGAVGAHPLLKAMGKHLRPSMVYNDVYTEAYNEIWNFRARNRSPDITPRALTDTSFAKAFWMHQRFAHIVPDFDQASIEGEVPLTVADGRLPVRGLGIFSQGASPGNYSSAVKFTDDWVPPAGTATKGWIGADTTVSPAVTKTFLQYASGSGGSALPDIFAELAENGVSVSLANIELARRTQAFAMLRKQYTGHTDDYIIDLLMNGITVPEQAWRQPILLADRSTIFGMAKRYASDSLDLTASVVNGATFVDLAITTPVVPMGGVVMICVEVTPEQLFERMEDHFLTTTDQDMYPEFLRDTLDPEKVEVVQNQFVDMNHTAPTGVFGYAPLNHKWNCSYAAIGGKFFRPAVDAPTDEDRQRIWAVETMNPTLSEDFYLCSNMHTKPFVVTNQDPFEVVLRGLAAIDGNTVFGRMLVEASDDYNQVMAEAPLDTIDKPAATEAEGDESDAANS